MVEQASKVRVEICVDSLGGVRAAESGGADRVELCGSLIEGGTTPSHGLIAAALEASSLPVFCMIRPRAGDFLYDDDEFTIALRDARATRRLGVPGLVFGCLTADGEIDVDRMRRFMDVAEEAEVTFHRAFDVSRSRDRALDALIELGVRRVLTSGGCASAPEGADEIARLVERANGRLSIMPGGGVRPVNAASLSQTTGVSELHFSARARRNSLMRYRSGEIRMGVQELPGEFERFETDPELVRAMRAALDDPA